MAKIDKDGQKVDSDILRSRAGVLRAADIIPPFGPKKPQLPLTKEVTPNQPPDKAPIPIRSIPEFEEILSKSAKQAIPEFNLADQIFAEHREVSSSKRKRPGSAPRTEMRAQSGGLAEKPQGSPPSPQQRIIAAIIARDIEDMVRRSFQSSG